MTTSRTVTPCAETVRAMGQTPAPVVDATRAKRSHRRAIGIGTALTGATRGSADKRRLPQITPCFGDGGIGVDEEEAHIRAPVSVGLEGEGRPSPTVG